MDKWLILGLEEGKYIRSLQPFTVPAGNTWLQEKTKGEAFQKHKEANNMINSSVAKTGIVSARK